jgi:raffinose/stachyose/melibiose transport system permease protein
MNMKIKKHYIKNPLIYIILLLQTIIVLFPIYTLLVIPLKNNQDIFKNPFQIPVNITFENFKKVWAQANFVTYYNNSIIVVGISLICIVFFSSMAAYVLTRFNFWGKTQIYALFLAGMIIPIRLGVLNIFYIMQAFKLMDTLLSLIFVYIAMCMPISILIFGNFMKSLPVAIEESAMIEGCSMQAIFSRIVFPLIKPALVTVVIYNFLPIWNDFYFPLIFIRSTAKRTIPLGVALYFGQQQTNWALIFAALSTASVPPILTYLFLSKYFIRGIVAGAVKG